jgi:hypothetical protein
VSPFWTADCPEKRRGLLLLLLLKGRWIVMSCRKVQRIPSVCWLRHVDMWGHLVIRRLRCEFVGVTNICGIL